MKLNLYWSVLLFAIPAAISAQTNVFPSSGSVGIGTTSPGGGLEINYAGGQLKLTGGTVPAGLFTSETDLLHLADWATAMKGLTINLTSGNLGVGTVSPKSQLHLASDSDHALSLSRSDGSYGFRILRDAALGNVYFQIATGPTSAWETKIRVGEGEGPGTNLLFNPDGGNVGIGTINPGGLLEIKGPYTGSSQVNINTTSSNAELRFSDNGVARGFVSYNKSNDVMAFGRGNFENSIIVTSLGNVGIGTSNPTEKFTVNGTIYGKEIKVDLSVPGPDYVFEEDYDLMSLEEIEEFIDKHKHLPGVPAAPEMEANGIELAKMNMILLRKVEELTLYLIELNDKNAMREAELLEKICQLEEGKLQNDMLKRIEALESMVDNRE